MRMSIKQLKRLILKEMKLGIAGAEGDARHWGKKPLPDEPIYEPGKEGTEFIATEDPPNFDPGEDIRALYRPRGGVDMAGDEIDDEYEDELVAHGGVDANDRPTRPAGMRGNLKRAG